MPVTFEHEMAPLVSGMAAFRGGHADNQMKGAEQQQAWNQQQQQLQQQAMQHTTGQLFGLYSDVANAQIAQQNRVDMANLSHRNAIDQLNAEQKAKLDTYFVSNYGFTHSDGLAQAQKAGLPFNQFIDQLDTQKQIKSRVAQLEASGMEMGYTDDQIHRQQVAEAEVGYVMRDPELDQNQRQEAAAQVKARYADAYVQQPVKRKDPYPAGMGAGSAFPATRLDPSAPSNLWFTRTSRGDLRSFQYKPANTPSSKIEPQQAYSAYMQSLKDMQAQGVPTPKPKAFGQWYQDTYLIDLGDGAKYDTHFGRMVQPKPTREEGTFDVEYEESVAEAKQRLVNDTQQVDDKTGAVKPDTINRSRPATMKPEPTEADIIKVFRERQQRKAAVKAATTQPAASSTQPPAARFNLNDPRIQELRKLAPYSQVARDALQQMGIQP